MTGASISTERVYFLSKTVKDFADKKSENARSPRRFLNYVWQYGHRNGVTSKRYLRQSASTDYNPFRHDLCARSGRSDLIDIFHCQSCLHATRYYRFIGENQSAELLIS